MARYRNRGAVAAGMALQNLARILADFGIQGQRERQRMEEEDRRMEREIALRSAAAGAYQGDDARLRGWSDMVSGMNETAALGERREDFMGASPREQVQQFSVRPEQWMATALEAGGRVPLDNRIAGDPSEVGIAYADPTTGQVTPSQINSPKQAAPSVFDAPGSPFEGRKPWEQARALEEATAEREMENALPLSRGEQYQRGRDQRSDLDAIARRAREGNAATQREGEALMSLQRRYASDAFKRVAAEGAGNLGMDPMQMLLAGGADGVPLTQQLMSRSIDLANTDIMRENAARAAQGLPPIPLLRKDIMPPPEFFMPQPGDGSGTTSSGVRYNFEE